MPRGRSEQRRQNKEQHPIGHHRNKEKPYAVATERSFDGKGDAADEEQHRQHRLKAKKELVSFTLGHLRSPPKHGPRRWSLRLWRRPPPPSSLPRRPWLGSARPYPSCAA